MRRKASRVSGSSNGKILYRLYPLLPFDIYVGIIVLVNGHLFL